MKLLTYSKLIRSVSTTTDNQILASCYSAFRKLQEVKQLIKKIWQNCYQVAGIIGTRSIADHFDIELAISRRIEFAEIDALPSAEQEFSALDDYRYA
jgi:hypothetical protein